VNQESAGHCLAGGTSLFPIESLPFSRIPQQSKLFVDYQQTPLSLKKFYPSVIESHTAITRNIPEVLANYKTDRNLLCDALEELNKNFGAGHETLENINRLRENDCVTIVTGQQAGLFSGAIYTVYKALSAVKLAECLRGRGQKAVPVFWIAEEDHDFDEVKKTYVLSEKSVSAGESALSVPPASADGFKLRELENTPRDYMKNSPVGSVNLDETIGETIDEFFGSVPHTEFTDELRAILKASYQPGESYSAAFARFLTKIFASYGLIIFSPLDKRLKNLSAPVFAEAVEKSDEIREKLLARNDELKAAGYGAQVLVEKDFFPFFWIDETGRRRALKKNNNGKIHAKDTKREFDLPELVEIAREAPENLSPNALMRPVVQDFLLPTVAYFGGGAEIAYFAQNSVIYEILQRPVTPILHRQSFTVIEAKHARTFKKYDLKLTDLFDGFEQVLPKIVETYLNRQTAQIFAEAEELINTQLNRLDRNLAASEPTLAENLATRRRKILYHIGALRTKFHYAQIRKDETINRRIEALFTALWPHKALQERTLNVLTFLNAHGLYFIDWIYEGIDLDDKGHRIIYL
jgi:bacillithiol biosynthesis cysteine-adding enzyme BshC